MKCTRCGHSPENHKVAGANHLAPPTACLVGRSYDRLTKAPCPCLVYRVIPFDTWACGFKPKADA